MNEIRGVFYKRFKFSQDFIVIFMVFLGVIVRSLRIDRSDKPDFIRVSIYLAEFIQSRRITKEIGRIDGQFPRF